MNVAGHSSISSRANESSVEGRDALGWDDSIFTNSGDLQFQLPSFLGPSSQAAPGGGVETAPHRSVGDWNGPAFESMGDGMSMMAGGEGECWDSLPNWSSSFNSPPLKFESAQPEPPTDVANIILPNRSSEDVTMHSSDLSPTYHTSSNDKSNPFHLPAQPSEEQAFPNGSHLLPSGPTMGAIPPIGKTMPGLYSSTGFDVLGVLSRVVTRPNPRTVLGPVDFSCSFLVVDVRKFDSPIVYASPTFTDLTGYEAKEIVGKNCRFLQAPNGEVQKGSRRKFTDNIAVAHLQRQLAQGKECQASLINYKKGGVPFINLVTVVPIPWDSEEIVFHVGFQVDLVESPNAILRNIKSGTYQVNYAVLNNPHLPMAPAGQLSQHLGRLGNSSLNSDILEVLGSKANVAEFAGGEDSLTAEWFKTIFEHSDDFIQVLSLKGQFQYVSPSVRRVLEYEPEDLVNKYISDICHPSDVVPVMRELKDSTQPPADGQAARTVNFLFRVKKKESGMVWMECTGRLHVEAGKGRKAVILCGRERVLPKLDWNVIGEAGGVTPAGKEMWTTVSFEGLVLYASSSVSTLLQHKDEVVGSSLLDYVPSTEASLPPLPAQPASVGATQTINEPPHDRIRRALKAASEGLPKRSSTSVRHQMISPAAEGKLAQVLDVISVFYAVDQHNKTWEGESSASPWGSSASLSPAGSDDTDSFEVGGGVGPSQRKVKPVSLIVQIKVLSISPLSPSAPSESSPTPHLITSSNIVHNVLGRLTVHDGERDVNEELSTTRSSGWQYELHQLKNENRKLREHLHGLKEAKLGRGKSKSAESGGSGGGGQGNGRSASGSSMPKRKRDSPSDSAPMGPPASLPSRTSNEQQYSYQPQQQYVPSHQQPMSSYPSSSPNAFASASPVPPAQQPYAGPSYTHPSQQISTTYHSPSYYSHQQQAQAQAAQAQAQSRPLHYQPAPSYTESPISYAAPGHLHPHPSMPTYAPQPSQYPPQHQPPPQPQSHPSSSFFPLSHHQQPLPGPSQKPQPPPPQQQPARLTQQEYSAFIQQQHRSRIHQ